jgi:hypothetical protein
MDQARSSGGGCAFPQIPEDLRHQIAFFLEAPDIIHWSITSRDWYRTFHEESSRCCKDESKSKDNNSSLACSVTFWSQLFDVHFSEPLLEANNARPQGFSEETMSNSSNKPQPQCQNADHGHGNTVASVTADDGQAMEPLSINNMKCKQKYLIQYQMSKLEQVRWHPVKRTCPMQRHSTIPRAREGHLMCILGQFIVLQGGFCDDDDLYLLPTSATNSSASASISSPSPSRALAPPNQSRPQQEWIQLRNTTSPSFVYGASLTPLLDVQKSNDHRAIRFGGFAAGGYSGEVNSVHLLTVKDHHTSAAAGEPTGPNKNVSAQWTRIRTQGEAPTARAYHTATLLCGRYLLIVGGMTTQCSILEEAVLDTHTWTWLDASPLHTAGLMSAHSKPTERFGHSMIPDPRRSRLVMFGGGNGSDLMRSGHDNCEVWALHMDPGDMYGPSDQALQIEKWHWKRVLRDDGSSSSWMDIDAPGSSDSQSGSAAGVANLTLTERLNVGRCHLAFKVAPEKVLFLFGSARPSTNGALAFDLSKDEYIPFTSSNIEGPLPQPRFTAAGVMLPVSVDPRISQHGEEELGGWIVVHGGFCGQDGHTLLDVQVLDLAPVLTAHPSHGRQFKLLPLQKSEESSTSSTPVVSILSHPPVEESHVLRQRDQWQLSRSLSQLMAMDPARRPAAAHAMWLELVTRNGGNPDNGDGTDAAAPLDTNNECETLLLMLARGEVQLPEPNRQSYSYEEEE